MKRASNLFFVRQSINDRQKRVFNREWTAVFFISSKSSKQFCFCSKRDIICSKIMEKRMFIFSWLLWVQHRKRGSSWGECSRELPWRRIPCPENEKWTKIKLKDLDILAHWKLLKWLFTGNPYMLTSTCDEKNSSNLTITLSLIWAFLLLQSKIY